MTRTVLHCHHLIRSIPPPPTLPCPSHLNLSSPSTFPFTSSLAPRTLPSSRPSTPRYNVHPTPPKLFFPSSPLRTLSGTGSPLPPRFKDPVRTDQPEEKPSISSVRNVRRRRKRSGPARGPGGTHRVAIPSKLCSPLDDPNQGRGAATAVVYISHTKATGLARSPAASVVTSPIILSVSHFNPGQYSHVALFQNNALRITRHTLSERLNVRFTRLSCVLSTNLFAQSVGDSS
ncbi:hypothetical protein CNYM01_03907 [Colletotrichum nymphaeae SA-01]|uniref:Uncharacterized protein n=1 Tax=Colletotrichum nymphaeae SA-01 TaxID=1460502 RepID=A0A135SFG9_9PEZI|nr:hypothetical protein CNYM01_03907 [Colletotrichum nymphaeae SA-01]